jgi:putative membrane protein
MKKFYAVLIFLVLVTVVSFGFVAKGLNQDKFWTEAAQGGMAEVMLANLALEKSNNEEIKSFAQKIVTDHTAVGEELKTLAASKNVTLPTDISAKQKASMDKLSNLSGTDFDREFMKLMVKDHGAAVKLFQKQADGGTDADVKAFAAKNLPTLQEHLSMARTMSGGMKNMNSNSNSNRNMNSNMMMNSNNRNSNRNMNSNSNMNMNSNVNNM